MKPSLCLNMIVKNEADRIERALASVTATVKAIFLHDTGSTDDTVAKAYAFANAHNIPIHVSNGPFENFSQARNDAFRIAKTLNGAGDLPWCQFALLMDADMELVVDAPSVFHKLKATAASYDMMQKGGSVSYANRRIVNFDCAKVPYVGVTHEYIDVPTAGMIEGARFIDHADGANRANKYARDVALLEAALAVDPSNGRDRYYLANSYRDWGRYGDAATHYGQRITLGGWDEETHSAMMNLADCLKEMHDEDDYVAQMLRAYNFRPCRSEPLYELAKFYRERGDNAAALLFARAGLNTERPDDLLFVNDFVYEHGLRYEYSIAGYYNPKERARAFEVTDDLALDPTCPPEYRASARRNLYHFTKPLSVYCPSFTPTKLAFEPPAGYTTMNPSVEQCNGRIYCNIRCVNYKINEHGHYMIGEKGCGDAPIDTRNFVVRLTDDMRVGKAREIVWERPPAAFPLVTGLEDVRLWRYGGSLHFSATVRELSATGLCQMVQGRLSGDSTSDDAMTVKEWKVISDGDAHQKNWMPSPSDPFGPPKYFYRLNTTIEPDAPKKIATVHPTKVYTDEISGSSQAIPFKSGLIAIVHEAENGPDGKRTYWHRFAWFEKDGRLRRLSMPFVFLDKQIEFCAGIAYHPNCRDLIVSFGVRDAEAYVATVSIEEVAMMVWKFHEG